MRPIQGVPFLFFADAELRVKDTYSERQQHDFLSPAQVLTSVFLPSSSPLVSVVISLIHSGLIRMESASRVFFSSCFGYSLLSFAELQLTNTYQVLWMSVCCTCAEGRGQDSRVADSPLDVPNDSNWSR